jgi:cytochrome c556
MRNLTCRVGLVLLLVGAATAAIALSSDQDAGAKTDYQPVCNLKDIMNALNGEEDGFYGMMKAFADKNPSREDKAWAIMRHRAMMVAEGGQLLTEMDAPKGDPASWTAKAEAFRDAAKALKRPMAMRKGDKLKAQLAVVRKACDSCHDAHRPE